MALFNFRSKSDSQAQESKRKPRARQVADTVEDMRRRARHRLIGACLLVLVGIIVFPLIFDRQPRPVQVVAQVEIPGVGSAQPLLPPRPSIASQSEASHSSGLAQGEEIFNPIESQPVAPVSASQQAQSTPSSRTDSSTNGAANNAPSRSLAQNAAQGAVSNSSSASAPSQSAASAQSSAAENSTASTQQAAARPSPPPAPVLTPPASRNTDAERARALLEGRSVETVVPSRAEQGRFIVQVGAYTDETKVREIRAQLEKLGLSVYTQVVETASGRATRVRVGPFGSRDDADRAATKIKSTNLPTVILTL